MFWLIGHPTMLGLDEHSRRHDLCKTLSVGQQRGKPGLQRRVTILASATLDEIYTYHPPGGNQAERYAELRDGAKRLAQLIERLTPPSREQSVALTNVQQAVMWANAAIAINEREE